MRSVGPLSLLTLALVLASCTDQPTSPAVAGDGEIAAGKANLPFLETARVVESGFEVRNELPNAKQFDLQLRFLTALSASHQAVFEAAESRWERLIVADVPRITGGIPANFCVGGFPAFAGDIDDLLIDVAVIPIDGPLGILGAAGPCAIRFSDDLPAYGVMFFDVADLDFIAQFGVLDEVILHEMGHVIGIGTLWNFNRQLRVGTGTPDPRFVGHHAQALYRAIGGVGTIPVEGQFGPGTAGGHWDEDTFATELMTGFVGLGSSPLSRMTTASLKDLGYVTATLGDPYELPQSTAALRTSAAESLDLERGELLISPKAYIR